MVTGFGYDEMGRKISQTDALGRTTRMGYDVRGRMNRRELPDGKHEAMEYDDLGQLRKKSDFRGYITRYDYDLRGRMTAKVPDPSLGEPSVSYLYTGENFKVAKRGALTTTYTYDANRGWLDSVSGPSGTVEYAYNSYGERTGVSAPGGVTAYTYDVLGRMETVSDKPSGATAFKLLATYGYDALGNLDHTLTSNGASQTLATTRYKYDDLNRLDTMSHRRGLEETGALVSGYDYEVRADGKRTSLAETLVNGDEVNGAPRVSNRNVGFTYDDAGRLTSESGKDGLSVSYRVVWNLDSVGNRTSETRLRAKDAASSDWAGGNLTRNVSNYSAAGNDWLTLTSSTSGAATAAGSFAGDTSASQTRYGYDAAGNQTRETSGENSKGLEWDFEGRLTRVEKGEGDATSFTYDASGQRVRAFMRAGAVDSAINFLVDENTAYAQVLEERDGAGVLQARYVYGQGFGPILLQRVQKNTSNVNEVRTRFLLADGHGSVRQLMDSSGVVTDSYFYDAWGNGLSGGSGNTVNPYRYNGQQTDAATGGYYLRARYYQPGSARFLGHDPFLGDEEDPISLHRYLFAANDGINYCDPSGEITIGELGSAIAGQAQQVSRIWNVASAKNKIEGTLSAVGFAAAITYGLLYPNRTNAGITYDFDFSGKTFGKWKLPDNIKFGFETRTASRNGIPVESLIFRMAVDRRRYRFSINSDSTFSVSAGVNHEFFARDLGGVKFTVALAVRFGAGSNIGAQDGSSYSLRAGIGLEFKFETKGDFLSSKMFPSLKTLPAAFRSSPLSRSLTYRIRSGQVSYSPQSGFQLYYGPFDTDETQSYDIGDSN